VVTLPATHVPFAAVFTECPYTVTTSPFENPWALEVTTIGLALVELATALAVLHFAAAGAPLPVTSREEAAAPASKLPRNVREPLICV
jgi:hypothetical protein